MSGKKVWHCQAVDCPTPGTVIPEMRVFAALTRGREPRFCSPECQNRQTSREAYDRKRKGPENDLRRKDVKAKKARKKGSGK